MRYLLLALMGVLLPWSTASAERVCLERATGKVLEYQSHATEGTLLKNAVAAGFLLSDVEEREVTSQEWAALRETWIDAPARKDAEKDKPVEIPLSDFGAIAGGLAGAAALVVVARKKKGTP